MASSTRDEVQTPPPEGDSASAPAHDDLLPSAKWEMERGRRKMTPDLLHTAVDVQDTVNYWCEAVIQELDFTKDAVYVHYIFWTSRWDEWIPFQSPRIAPRGSKIFLPGGTLRVGQRVDVYDPHPSHLAFLDAKIVEERPDAVKIHYKAYSSSLDEWLPRNSDRIAPHGWHTRTKQPYQPRKQSYWAHNERKAQLTSAPGAADARVMAYITALAAAGLRVLPMGGDGNCLFRSVSHQLYGNEEQHALVRASAADYMDVERAFFSDFVVDGPGQFDAYLEAIRRPGEWGDDPEIQAICELYDRPAEIWAFDPAVGARRLRTFLSGRSDSRPPIRLSYFGGGHYDSVVGGDWEANMIADPPGLVEDRRLDGARRMRALAAAGGGAAGAAAFAGDAAAAEAATLAAALEASRRQYDESDASVEVALLVSLGLDPATAAQAAARAAATSGAAVGGAGAAGPVLGAGSAGGAAGPNGGAGGNGQGGQGVGAGQNVGGVAAEDVILRATLRASEEAAARAADAQLQAALAASRDAVGGDDAALEVALAESRAAAAGAGGIPGGEDPELAAVLAASRAEAAGGLGLGMGMGMGMGMAADDDVAAAIAMSLADPHASGGGGIGLGAGAAAGDAYGALLDLQAAMTEEEQIEAVMTGRLPARLGGALISGSGSGSGSSGSGSGGSAGAGSSSSSGSGSSAAAPAAASGGAGAGPAAGGAGSAAPAVSPAAAAAAGGAQGQGQGQGAQAAAGSQQLFQFQLQPPSQQGQGQAQGQGQQQQPPAQQGQAAAAAVVPAPAPAPLPAAAHGMDEDDVELQAALAMSLAGSL